MNIFKIFGTKKTSYGGENSLENLQNAYLNGHISENEYISMVEAEKNGEDSSLDTSDREIKEKLEKQMSLNPLLIFSLLKKRF